MMLAFGEPFRGSPPPQHAGVVKLADARDSKSRGVYAP
jgi:hypothetical protein